MSGSTLALWTILWPALAAGGLVTATHVPLGVQVLRRGIVFIDLAIAQIAGLGVIMAHRAGFEGLGFESQLFALAAALLGALLLVWTDRRWPAVQEAIIGCVFVLAASAALLLLAADPHGGAHLQELLVGQILWVSPRQLAPVALASAVIVGLWLSIGSRRGPVVFYLLFACAVTLSVQLVGLYLVFATLIVPALATRSLVRGRLAAGYAVGVLGYAGGLVASTWTDLPAGPTVVFAMAVVGLLFAGLEHARPRATQRH